MVLQESIKKTMKNDNITILVSTCDNYHDLWLNNKMLFDRFWPNHPSIIYFSDNNTYEPNFDVLCVGAFEFSSRLKTVLDSIKTKYVFLTLDDYLLDTFVDNQSFDFCLNFLEKNCGDYFRFFKRTKVKGKYVEKKHKIKQLPLTKKAYEINLYPSIWNTESLRKIIKKEENIWKFEVRLTRRAKENQYKAFASYDSHIFHFVDTIRKGKYLRRAHKFLRKQNLYVSDRQKRTVSETLALAIRTFFSRHLPKKLKKFIKKKSGKIYFSDYADGEE